MSVNEDNSQFADRLRAARGEPPLGTMARTKRRLSELNAFLRQKRDFKPVVILEQDGKTMEDAIDELRRDAERACR